MGRSVTRILDPVEAHLVIGAVDAVHGVLVVISPGSEIEPEIRSVIVIELVNGGRYRADSIAVDDLAQHPILPDPCLSSSQPQKPAVGPGGGPADGFLLDVPDIYDVGAVKTG